MNRNSILSKFKMITLIFTAVTQIITSVVVFHYCTENSVIHLIIIMFNSFSLFGS